MPFCKLVIIFVMPSARYSHVSVILSRSGPLGMPSDGLAVVVMELAGAILKGGDRFAGCSDARQVGRDAWEAEAVVETGARCPVR